MKPHPLTNFRQKYYQNGSKFNGIFFQEIIYLK